MTTQGRHLSLEV